MTEAIPARRKAPRWRRRLFRSPLALIGMTIIALFLIVVAFAPLVFAARLWPATRGASRKLLDLLVALIVSKLVIAIALSVAAAAAVGAAWCPSRSSSSSQVLRRRPPAHRRRPRR